MRRLEQRAFPGLSTRGVVACAPDLRAYAVQCSHRGAGTGLYCPVVRLFSTLWEVRRYLRISASISAGSRRLKDPSGALDARSGCETHFASNRNRTVKMRHRTVKASGIFPR